MEVLYHTGNSSVTKSDVNKLFIKSLRLILNPGNEIFTVLITFKVKYKHNVIKMRSNYFSLYFRNEILKEKRKVYRLHL